MDWEGAGRSRRRVTRPRSQGSRAEFVGHVDGSTRNAEIESLEDTNISPSWQAPDGGRAGPLSLDEGIKTWFVLRTYCPRSTIGHPMRAVWGDTASAPLRQRERSRS